VKVKIKRLIENKTNSCSLQYWQWWKFDILYDL